MKKLAKSEKEIGKEVEETHMEIQPALYEYTTKQIETFGEIENDLNDKILKITLVINDEYPELSKYIGEMTATIPNEKDARITLKNLQAYYDSLNAVLSKYRSEHPKK